MSRGTKCCNYIHLATCGLHFNGVVASFEATMTCRQLRSSIDALGLTVAQTAARLGVDRSHLYAILRGVYPVPGPVAAAVSAWLEIDRLQRHR
jgi:hypothetical protein